MDGNVTICRPLAEKFLRNMKRNSRAQKIDEKGKECMSKCYLNILLICLFYVFQTSLYAMDKLTLWGEGWKFSVREPINWRGDTEKAEEFQSNIIFYQKDKGPNNTSVLIRIRVNSKVDDNTQSDLEYDMEGYRKEEPNVKFKDITVSHEKYRCYSKLFYVKNKFYEYVVYMNLGKNIPWTLAISMNKQKSEATESEFNIFKDIILSIIWLSENNKDVTNDSTTRISSSNRIKFKDAIKLAEENMKTKKGEMFDKDFALSCGTWLVDVMKQCTSISSKKEFIPLIFLFRVSLSGNIEEILVEPVTKLSECIKPTFYSRTYPKPPGSSWWVRMDINTK